MAGQVLCGHINGLVLAVKIMVKIMYENDDDHDDGGGDWPGRCCAATSTAWRWWSK